MTALAVRPAPSPMETTLGQIIAPFEAQLAPFLRDGITLERVAAELTLASRKTPNLDKCEPHALVDAVCRALGTGGTIGQEVYIVPFFDSRRKVYEPTVMVDYKYKAEMVVRAGGARSIVARTVYANEHFTIQYGTEERIEHRPLVTAGAAGDMVGAYAVAHMGAITPPVVKWLRIDEIERIRKRSKEWNPEKYPAPIPWYGEKCAVHRLVKLLPKNQRLRSILSLIDDEERVEFGETSALTQQSRAPEEADDMTDAEIAAMDEGLGLDDRKPTRNAVKEGR